MQFTFSVIHKSANQNFIIWKFGFKVQLKQTKCKYRKSMGWNLSALTGLISFYLAKNAILSSSKKTFPWMGKISKTKSSDYWFALPGLSHMPISWRNYYKPRRLVQQDCRMWLDWTEMVIRRRIFEMITRNPRERESRTVSTKYTHILLSKM